MAGNSSKLCQVTEAQVRAVATPAPQGRWHPIGHALFLDMVNEQLGIQDIEVTGKKFFLYDEGQQFYGVYDLGGVTASIPGSLGFQLGIRGSINKTWAETLAFMTRILICTNGLTAEERPCGKRKNTTNILEALSETIQEALFDLGLFKKIQFAQYAKLCETPLTDMEAHDFICKSLRTKDNREVLTGGDAVNVINEWHDPSHDFGDKTAWRLHNAYTEVSKRVGERNAIMKAARDLRMNRLFQATWAGELPSIEELRVGKGEQTVADQMARWGTI